MRNHNANIEARRRSIVSMLQKDSLLTVKEIGEAFHISEVTARRDLNILASKNLVERTHGGVRLNQVVIQDTPFFLEKNEAHREEKDCIAKAAAARLESGDVVFMNAGTTVLFIPKYITTPDIQIVTNNPCMAITEGAQNTNLIITGGEHAPQTQSLVGDIVLQTLSKIRANKCIICVNGISAEYGVTSANYMETAVNSAMLSRCSGERIVIADSSKIGLTFSFISAHMDMIDTLITDSNAPQDEIQRIRKAGVNVIIAN